MYVIFPAEDLICMTYGVAVPRFKPRPSLDCLREPLLPLESSRGAKPSKSSCSTAAATRKEPDTNVTTDRHVLGTPILNLQSNSPVHVPSTPATPSLPQPQPYFPERQSSNPPQLRPSSRRTSLLQVPNSSSSSSGGGVAKKEKKRRDLTPLRNATVTYEQLNAEEEPYDDYNPTETDPLNDDSDPYFERERSPSEFFETAVSYPVLLPPSHSQENANRDKAKNGNKKKSRLHLSLGRLGRHQELNETIRVRDELQYHVANPTFTRENLIQRNYDAFFESGEPVYSLEKRTLDTPETPIDQPLERTYKQNTSMSSPSSSYLSGKRHSQNFFQHGLAGPAVSAPTSRPKTVSYMPQMGNQSGSSDAIATYLSSARAQSVEVDSRRSTSSRRGLSEMMMMGGGSGVTPKGDRCPSFNRFGLTTE